MDTVGIHLASHLSVATTLRCLVPLTPTDVISAVAFAPFHSSHSRKGDVLLISRNGKLEAYKVPSKAAATQLDVSFSKTMLSTSHTIEHLILHEDSGTLLLGTNVG